MTRNGVILLCFLVVLTMFDEASACSRERNLLPECKNLKCQNDGRCVIHNGVSKCACRRFGKTKPNSEKTYVGYQVYLWNYYGDRCQYLDNSLRYSHFCNSGREVHGIRTCYCDPFYERCLFINPNVAKLCRH